MKTRMAAVLPAALALAACTSPAATLPGAMTRDSMVVSRRMDRISIGADYEEIERGIELGDGETAVLRARAAALYVGVDLASSLTAFATLGGSAVEEADGGHADDDLKWSVGLSANLWHTDLVEPEPVAGRLSLKAMAELTRYRSDDGAGVTEWFDVSLAFPVGYEMFAGGVDSPGASLSLYAGPVLSWIDGESGAAGEDVDFGEDKLLGLLGGADVYLAANLCLGIQVLAFDETTIRGSLRYHF